MTGQIDMSEPLRYVLEFEVIGLPKMANQLLRRNWRVNYGHSKLWKAKVGKALLLKIKPPQPLSSAVLTLTRASSQEPDFDGLVSGFKPVIDALVINGIIESDKPSCIKTPTFIWEKALPGLGKIKIRVEAK